jgi:hypothetical protein
MEVIYAQGRPGHLDFYITDEQEAVPAGAIIFAVCTATSTIENTDEDLFEAITDQEYFTIKEMVYEACRREAAQAQAKCATTQSTLEISVTRFLRWLTVSPVPAKTASLQKNPSNC